MFDDSQSKWAWRKNGGKYVVITPENKLMQKYIEV